MSDLDRVTDALYRQWEHIDYLKCRCSHCPDHCRKQHTIIHPVSDKTRRRLARDMARAALTEMGHAA